MANSITIEVNARDNASGVFATVRQNAAPLESGLASLHSKALLASAGITAIGGALVGAAAVMKTTVDAASDLNESQNKASVVFGASARAVHDFAQVSASSFGLSAREATAAAGAYGSMFRTIGLGQEEAAQMSVRLAQLASDMASFNNQDPSEMLQKLRAGLAGEAEPLRTVGVLLSEARVKQEAYASGIAATGAELTEAQKVQARYNLILKDTSLQQGDFARTSDGLANAQRRLSAGFDDLKVKIGQGVVGPMEGAVDITADLIGNINTLIDKARQPIQFKVTVDGEVQMRQGPSAVDVLGQVATDPLGLDRLDRQLKGSGIVDFLGNLDPIFGRGGIPRRPDPIPMFEGEGFGISVGSFGSSTAGEGFDFAGFNSWAMQNGVPGLNQLGPSPVDLSTGTSAGGSGASPLSRALDSVTSGLQKQLLDAYRVGGEEQYVAVKAAQDNMMASVRAGADTLVQKFGIEYPDALQSMFDAQSRILQDTLDEQLRITTEARDAEIAAYLEGGDERLRIVTKEQQDRAMSIGIMAADVAQRFGVEMPNAIRAATAAADAHTAALKREAEQRADMVRSLGALNFSPALIQALQNARPGQSFSSADLARRGGGGVVQAIGPADSGMTIVVNAPVGADLARAGRDIGEAINAAAKSGGPVILAGAVQQ